MGLQGSRTVHVDAAPEALYAMLSDVRRMGEWSPETYEAEWIEGATGPAVGARFRGRNRRGRLKWSTKCTVVTAEPGREFTFVVGTADRPATRWSYRFTPAGAGTDVTESFEALKYGFAGKLFASPGRAQAKLEAGCARTLEHLKATAEGG